MLGPVHIRALDRPRRTAFLRRDREGVASTVGTIMALLVFLAFMALITNSYVPAWMLDNERAHMNSVIDQFGELKGDIDAMIVEQKITGSSSVNMYAPIKLGADGVPLFASPTAGLLKLSPPGSGSTGVTVGFSYRLNNQFVPYNPTSGGGQLELYVSNRYYVEQWIAYENGALIISQKDGQTLKAIPDLTLNRTLGKVTFTQIDLLGVNSSISGADSVGVNLDLIYYDKQEPYDLRDLGGNPTDFTLTITTKYLTAWETYLENACAQEHMVKDQDYSLKANGAGLIFTVHNVNWLEYNRAYVSVTMLTS